MTIVFAIAFAAVIWIALCMHVNGEPKLYEPVEPIVIGEPKFTELNNGNRFTYWHSEAQIPLCPDQIEAFEDGLPPGQEIVFISTAQGLERGVALQWILVRKSRRN